MFEREDDPAAPLFPAEPMLPPPAPARPRLPKLRGATLEAVALGTIACAERADREAVQAGTVVALQSALEWLDKEHPEVFTDPTDLPRGAA